MQDRDWTGTAAAVTALAMTAGVWLWPQPRPITETPPTAITVGEHGGDMARWLAEARRWDGSDAAETVQLSAAQATDANPVVR